jgi:hypothetical protein
VGKIEGIEGIEEIEECTTTGIVDLTQTNTPEEVNSHENAFTDVKTLTERKINVPDRIVLFDGKKTKVINFESCEPLDYLKLCVSLNFYKEEGVV